MPTIPELINAHPGDVVVPLSDMLDLLASRLEDDELEIISKELIRRRTTDVAAGDVITAEMMNQVLADIASLQTRVSVLELGIPALDRPQIVLVSPEDGVRIGSELKVYGFNLSPSDLTSVSIGDRTVNVFKNSSHSRLLAFDVPSVIGIPQGGADVRLKITNEFGSDDIMVNILPFESTDLTATIFISGPTVPPDALLPNTTYTYTYSVSAVTTISATYTLSAEITGDSGWSAQVQGSNTLEIPRSQPSPFVKDVVVSVTTGSAGSPSGSASLVLKIVADDYPSEKGQSSSINLEIGGVTEINSEIAFAPIAVQNNAIDDSGAILVLPGDDIIFTVEATLSSAPETIGDTYNISDPVIINDDAGVWLPAPVLLSPATKVSDNINEVHLNSVKINLAAGTPSNTPTVKVRFTIAREGSTEPAAVFENAVKIQIVM